MLNIDKDASIELFRVAERTFARFGSTRLLGYGMLIAGVVGVLRSTDKPSEAMVEYGLTIAAVSFGILAVSYILRPHDPRRKEERKAEREESEEKEFPI
jgi:hypothetical protein